jgi:hypothetical protein
MLWPIYAEHIVNKVVEGQIQNTNSKVMKFHAKKGDILIWHAKLMHRGSIPKNPDLFRPAFIAHYSNIRGRRDFSADITRHGNGGYFWDFGVPIPDSNLASILVDTRSRVQKMAAPLRRFSRAIAGR